METRSTLRCLSALSPHEKTRICSVKNCRPKQPLALVNGNHSRTFHKSRVKASAHEATTGPAQRLIRMATGVPLSEAFKSMSLTQAALDSVITITATVSIVLFGNKLISYIGKKVDQVPLEEDGKQTKPLLGIVATIASAAERPAGVLLPWFGVAYCSTVLSAFAEVVVERLSCSDHGMHEFAGVCACRMATLLRDTAQLMQDTTEIVMITFVAWFFISFKNKLVEAIMSKASKDTIDSDNLARIVSPLSSIITWATVTIAVLSSLSALGINVQPFLAFGSVSTLAAGFAAQSTVSNVVSALSLYTARPFISGDRVQLKTLSGALVVSGTVDRVMPLHTIIKSDAGTPIFINNKDIASSLVVVNESKLTRATGIPPLPLIDTTITLRYKDIDLVPDIERSATSWMQSHPDMLPGSTCRCALEGFDSRGPVLTIKATLKREASSRRTQVVSNVLMRIERIVREHGAYLAVNSGVELPANLQTS